MIIYESYIKILYKYINRILTYCFRICSPKCRTAHFSDAKGPSRPCRAPGRALGTARQCPARPWHPPLAKRPLAPFYPGVLPWFYHVMPMICHVITYYTSCYNHVITCYNLMLYRINIPFKRFRSFTRIDGFTQALHRFFSRGLVIF